MHSLAFCIILHQFPERNRLKVIDITPSVQNTRSGNQQWPAIHIGVLMDISMNHVASVLMIPDYAFV